MRSVQITGCGPEALSKAGVSCLGLDHKKRIPMWMRGTWIFLS